MNPANPASPVSPLNPANPASPLNPNNRGCGSGGKIMLGEHSGVLMAVVGVSFLVSNIKNPAIVNPTMNTSELAILPSRSGMVVSTANIKVAIFWRVVFLGNRVLVSL